MKLPTPPTRLMQAGTLFRTVLLGSVMALALAPGEGDTATECRGVKFQFENTLNNAVTIQDLSIATRDGKNRERLSKQQIAAGDIYTTNKRNLNSVGVGQTVELVLRYTSERGGKQAKTVTSSRVCERNMTWRIKIE